MEIRQISEGDKIIMLVSGSDGKSASFESCARHIVDGNLLVDPFMSNGTLISFTGKNVKVDMLVVIEGQTPQMFKNVTVQRVSYMDKLYHMVTSNVPGVKMNRRAHYRLFIGEQAQVTIGDYPMMSATLKDVSVSGFSVIIPNSAQIDVSRHMPISISYSDAKSNTVFHMKGHIVRKAGNEESATTLYGCIQDHENNSIGRFIAARQMELRSLSRMMRITT